MALPPRRSLRPARVLVTNGRARRKRGRTRTGLPIGVQVVGPHWRDDTVLAVTDALEQHFEQGDDYPTTPVTLL